MSRDELLGPEIDPFTLGKDQVEAAQIAAANNRDRAPTEWTPADGPSQKNSDGERHDHTTHARRTQRHLLPHLQTTRQPPTRTTRRDAGGRGQMTTDLRVSIARDLRAIVKEATT